MKKLRKGDEVVVIAGRDKGRKGVILAVLTKENKVLVEGINTVKKHVKPNPNTGDKGGIIIKTHPIHISNVMLYDQAAAKGSRVGIRILEDNRKVRYNKATNEVVDV